MTWAQKGLNPCQPFNPDSTAMLPMCNILLTYKQEPPEIHIAFCLISYFWFIFKLPMIIIIIIIIKKHPPPFAIWNGASKRMRSYGVRPSLSYQPRSEPSFTMNNQDDDWKYERRKKSWVFNPPSIVLFTFALVSLWFTCRYMHL